MLPEGNIDKKGADLSIVVQGPIKHVSDEAGYSTVSVLRSARHHYPLAEIIYSGWEGVELPQEVRELADVVVLSPDPGPVQTFVNESGAPNLENTNRLIVSTTAGLRVARRLCAMKLRSDTLITANRLSQWLTLQREKKTLTTIFELPLVTASLFTRLFFFEYGGFRRCVGNLSDLFFFGLRSDLLQYWDGPLISQSLDVDNRDSAAAVEQLLTIRCLVNSCYLAKNVLIKKKFAPRIGTLDWFGWSRILGNNFVVLTERELGVSHPPRFRHVDFSRFIFEAEPSIAAVCGTRGVGKFLLFYLVKAVVFLEFQVKFAMRRLLGLQRYRAITRYILTHFIKRRPQGSMN